MSDEVVKKVSRPKAANQVVNSISPGDEGQVNWCELVDWIEDIVVRSGGKSDVPATKRALDRTLKSAVGLGVIRLHTNVFVERL